MGLLITQSGAVYLGTEQFLTLATVLAICGGILIFLLKHQFQQITAGIEENSNRIDQMKTELQENIKRQNDRTNERIDRLEEKTRNDIEELRQGMNDIKGDFATTFVQRDDFFRYMNGMEANIKDTNSKVDKILMLMTDRRNGNGTE